MPRAEGPQMGRWTFRTGVAAEARATWVNRFWGLWVSLASMVALAVLLTPDLNMQGWPFRALCIAAAWVSGSP